MAASVSPFRLVNASLVPLLTTLFGARVVNTGPPRVVPLVPPRPTGLLTSRTGKTVIGVAKPVVRSFPASRVGGAITAGAARSVNSSPPR